MVAILEILGEGKPTSRDVGRAYLLWDCEQVRSSELGELHISISHYLLPLDHYKLTLRTQ